MPVVAGCDCSWRWRSGAQAASCSAGGCPYVVCQAAAGSFVAGCGS